MEIVAAELEALVNQASNVLDTHAHELDLKLAKEARVQSSPINLIRLTKDMTHELDEMKKEAQSLMKEQEEIKQKLLLQMPEVNKKVLELDNQTGSNNNYISSALKNRVNNLNI